MKISIAETERICYTCGKLGHLARGYRGTKSTQLMGSNVYFSYNYEGQWARECSRNAPGERKPGSHLHEIGDHLHEIGDHRWQEFEKTKLWNEWGVRRWDHLQVVFQNGDRNRDFSHQVFPGMERTKGS
ncbi:hypothetical protein JTB14_018563 [Gonioctena quinquepunctata]|nr:hypothetical protein JTB14_018563 [Gonioctena quinquepunctata]